MSVAQSQSAVLIMGATGSSSCKGITEAEGDSDGETSVCGACSEASQSNFGSSISTDIEVVVRNTFIELRLEAEAAEVKPMTRSKSCPSFSRAESWQESSPQSEALLGRHALEPREEKPQVPQEQVLLAALFAESSVEAPPPQDDNRLWAANADGIFALSCPPPIEFTRDQGTASGVDQAMRTPLSGQAKIWRPAGNVFFTEACKIVENVGRMLKQTFAVSTEVQFHMLPDGRGKCKLVTTMSPGDLTSLGSAVVQAAEAGIYERTNRTCGVCLLGCKAEPFKQLSEGFCASLANVPIKRQECRSMYKQGHCCRGSRCSKEHPSIMVDFEFTLLAGLPLQKVD